MAFQISHSPGSLPVPRAEVAGPVATFHQLQQLLERSLRDLHAESRDLESAPERELGQALQRLSGRLHHILAELTNANLFNEEVGAASSDPVLLPVPNSAPLSGGPIHLMTSCDGVVLLANDAAVDGLGLAHIGTMSLAEWIPYEEWRLIRQQLKTGEPPQESVSGKSEKPI